MRRARRPSPVFLFAFLGFYRWLFAAFCRHRVGGDFAGWHFLVVVGERHIELQLEIHGWIVKAANRIEGNDQLLGDVGEGKADLEQALGDLQIPELMLDDDSHLFRIFRLQVLRNAHTGRSGQKGDEEMMVTGQTTGGADLGQHLTDNSTQGVLCQNVVADMILPHAFLSFVGHVFLRLMPRRAQTEKPSRESLPHHT